MYRIMERRPMRACLGHGLDTSSIRDNVGRSVAKTGFGIYARRGAPFLLRASNIGNCVNGGFHDSERTSSCYRTGGNFRGALCAQPWNANLVHERLEITQHLGFTGRPWWCCPQARR